MKCSDKRHTGKRPPFLVLEDHGSVGDAVGKELGEIVLAHGRVEARDVQPRFTEVRVRRRHHVHQLLVIGHVGTEQRRCVSTCHRKCRGQREANPSRPRGVFFFVCKFR
jgi:hypothetical protein